MLPGPLLKAEPLVVIIKDGGSVDLQEGLAWGGGGGDVAQDGEAREMKWDCCQSKVKSLVVATG